MKKMMARGSTHLSWKLVHSRPTDCHKLWRQKNLEEHSPAGSGESTLRIIVFESVTRRSTLACTSVTQKRRPLSCKGPISLCTCEDFGWLWHEQAWLLKINLLIFLFLEKKVTNTPLDRKNSRNGTLSTPNLEVNPRYGGRSHGIGLDNDAIRLVTIGIPGSIRSDKKGLEKPTFAHFWEWQQVKTFSAKCNLPIGAKK